MNDNALGIVAGGPPGASPGGAMSGRVTARFPGVPGRVVLAALNDLVTTLYSTDCHACVAYAVYQDQLRELVRPLKYERMRAIAKPLGVLLARAIEMLEGEAGDELLVVAVPLFPSKERERGYNQAVLLADFALSELKRSRPNWKLQAAHGVIRRVKDTRSQFELTPKGRRRNLQGASTVRDRTVLAGREVLLVDDIYTTGAITRTCARVLRRAGAGKVWVATVSRAQKEMVASWDFSASSDSPTSSDASAETAVWDAG